jgi:hypothetical protein
MNLVFDVKIMTCMFCFFLLAACLAVGAAGRFLDLAYIPYLEKIRESL